MTSTPKSWKFSGPPQSARNLAKAFLLVSFMSLLLAGCSVPNHGKVWLSYDRHLGGCDNMSNCPALTDETQASQYYQAIGAEDANGNPNFNLEQWKQLFGFQNATPVHAVYGNALDLRFGREMFCWQTPAPMRVACYVNNYGGVLDDFDSGVSYAAGGDIHNSFGTVAMVYDPNGIGANHDRVTFYAFGPVDANGNQPLIRQVRLDSEGLKNVPTMCNACHNGSFLPFDVQSFHFNSVLYDISSGSIEALPSPYNLDSQQEVFRQLNALVLATQPKGEITNLINGLYSGNVNTPGATVPDDTYIPAGWDVDRISRNLYRHVYRKYCRTCHAAQVFNYSSSVNLSFPGIADFDPDLVGSAVCGFNTHSMPNAEVPYAVIDPARVYGFNVTGGFWGDRVAQSDLHDYLAQFGPAGCY